MSSLNQFTKQQFKEESQQIPQPPQAQEQVPSQHNLMEQGPNPFDIQEYQNVGIPDVPISYGGGMSEQLLNDNEVPDEIKSKFWYLFHKDNVLTFLDEERKKSKLLNFDIIKIDILNNTPYYEYTFDMELQFTILRNVFETKLDRALGMSKPGQKNERVMLQSQFSENRQISEDNMAGNIKEGFFKRLLGRR